MKKYSIKYLMFALLFSATSCEKYLDINDNPNDPTVVQPELVLPAGLVRTASLAVAYNTYGASLGGYIANAGGFSGFGALLNYNFTPGFLSNWGGSYDNLLDYKYVIDNSEGVDELAYFNAVAKIMTVYGYQLLVDAHGDIPYTAALQSDANTTPAYDNAPAIYQDLVNKLDEAIGIIDNAQFPRALGFSADPMFGEDREPEEQMNLWKQFANTVKLRLLIRVSEVPALQDFVNSEFASFDEELGILTEDAIVNPGYELNKPNPTWSSWGYTTTGNVATSSRVPTYYVYGYYDGNKLTDPGRGSVIYNDFGDGSRPTPLNQLGVEQNNPPIRANYSPWYTGVRESASNISNALGIVKGPSQGQPILLLSEAYFLLAEAQLRGLLSGDAEESFEAGIAASFGYLYTTVSGTVDAGKDVDEDVETYLTDNSGSTLVNFSGNTEQKTEAIITQKYIALNMIHSHEGWNDYRRTGYPRTNPDADRYNNMASVNSNSTRLDELPTILLYPQTEFAYNPTNVRVLNQFSDLIFWAKQ
ncbi:SusD/RagB family nutrient-binding outer membrane lipoprotein [Parapedobacter tibetensis]|uniref:SusD/RagB family nutrient-binding outer membrane lipoprotein n=1 Tax=Parapedobacter tibetensis TaxID=2972951 RepID=UPI00214D4232|nr:SusD/RagB family nutrient-binding outer membrane lipoprotein [Parapedobacter tibetensis]